MEVHAMVNGEILVNTLQMEKYQKLNINIRLLTYTANLKRPKNDKALKEK